VHVSPSAACALPGGYHVDAEGVVLAVHHGRQGGVGQFAAARADLEYQPPARDDVDRGRHLGEHGRGADPVAGHDHAQPQPAGLGSEPGQQRPCLQRRPGRLAPQRHQVIPQPGVLEFGHRLSFPPDAQDLVICGASLAGLDPEAHPAGISSHNVLP
jgi:hypothetical protein